MKPFIHSACLVSLAALTIALNPVNAGQVRIEVGPDGSSSFSPSSISLNRGDQVAWVWRSGTHTVTQGTGCPASGPVFQSIQGPDIQFSWKSDRTGNVPYFSVPDCDAHMAGTLDIHESGIPVANFRITEVFRTNLHTDDFIEIENMGDADGNLGRYGLSFFVSQIWITLPQLDIIVPAKSRVVIHIGNVGTDTGTDFYFPDGQLNALGSVALYMPNPGNSVTGSANYIVDFVEWGSAGRPNEAVAGSAALWNTGSFVTKPADGRSMIFCGSATDHGSSFWQDGGDPTPGTNNCVVPTVPVTWGLLKTRTF